MRQRELKIKRVRGFLLIVAIVLLVVVALAIAAMGNMVSADIRSSSDQARSEQAYFAATSGTEYARRLYLTGTACGAGLNTSAAVGNSSFTTSGATLINVSSGTVTADTGTTITVGAMGAYASSGRIMIESEEIYYGAISGNNL
jgi:Tfp pilus assembly protein PilX